MINVEAAIFINANAVESEQVRSNMQESIQAASSVSERSSQKAGAKTLLLKALPFALFVLVGILAVAPFYSRTERAPNTHEPVKMLWTDDMPNHLASSKP